MIEQTEKTPIKPAVAIPPNAVDHGGKTYLPDAKGNLAPIESVKVTDLLMDEVVRKVVGYAQPLSAEVARFKQHSFDDVDSFVALLAQDYGSNLGGKKGNLTLTTIDGLMKVEVAVADLIVFGPELQIAKDLFDVCVLEWSAGSHDNIRALINKAFRTDKKGQVNRNELQSLMRTEINGDERWNRAVDAIRDSMRVIGSKRYVRVFTREDPDGQWTPVVLNVASASV